MIYAKTGMERMPERCADCDMEIGGTCFPKLVASERGKRPDWCPLIEIDETLPAQLAAAETTDKETEDTNAR